MNVAAGHTLTLDGEQGSDGYQVITTGSQGDPRNYVVNVLDTGRPAWTTWPSTGRMATTSSCSADDLDPGYRPGRMARRRAVGPGRLERTRRSSRCCRHARRRRPSDPNADPSVRPQEVQRVNYDLGIDDPGSGAAVLGLGGDDTFAVDGTSSDIVLDGGDGNDTFQFGQVYGSKRDILQTGGSLEPEDLFPAGFRPFPTVRGWLSRGHSLRSSRTAVRVTTRSSSTRTPPRSACSVGRAQRLHRGPSLFARTTGNCTDVTAPSCQFVWRDGVARVVMPLHPAAIS